uniref:hypothetical protein n=1 Tax=Polynucleobacter sp. TaxID=2029855 RepID=UPI00404772B9
MKRYEAYISIELKVSPQLMALNEVDAQERFYELQLEDLLTRIIDVSTVDVYSVRIVE